MTIVQVNTSDTIRDFHQLPFEIYKNDSNWIPHLEKDIESVFSKKENKFFRHGEAIRWLLKDDDFDNAKKTIESITYNSIQAAWECKKCQEENDESFDYCWKCHEENE